MTDIDKITHWLLRVGDGSNLKRSSEYQIWGIQNTTSPFGKHFTKTVKHGDRLWFVKNKSEGMIIPVATYKSHNNRLLSNEQLGWFGSGIDWIANNIEVHYTDLIWLEKYNYCTHIKGTTTIRNMIKIVVSIWQKNIQIL